MIYEGTASLTQFYSNVNTTHYTLVYMCKRCLLFDDPSQTGYTTSTSEGHWENGWAQSDISPADPTNADSDIIQHNNGMGEFEIMVASATQASYSVRSSFPHLNYLIRAFF